MFYIKKLNHFAWGLLPQGKDMNWQRAVKSPRVLFAVLFRVLHLAVGLVTPMWITCLKTISKKLLRLSRSQGLVGLVKNLKVLSIVTQQAAGGYRVNALNSLGPRISRTKSGLPRIIHPSHRDAIRKGNTTVVRMYLTIFGLYRVIEIPGKVKLHTITAPATYLKSRMDELKGFIPLFFHKLCKKISGSSTRGTLSNREVQKVLGYNNEESSSPTLRTYGILPVRTCGPLHGGSKMAYAIPKYVIQPDGCEDSFLYEAQQPTEYTYYLDEDYEIQNLLDDKQIEDLNRKWSGKFKRKDGTKVPPTTKSSVGDLWFTMANLMDSPYLKDFVDWITLFDCGHLKDLMHSCYNDTFAKIKPWGTSLHWSERTSGLGKLGFLEEPAGKIRVVAMVDVLTQTILYPLHKWLFSVLRKIPQDGTFDQRAPLELLVSKGVKVVHSYDLSAATDRLPVILQANILRWVLGHRVGTLWKNLLVNRTYSIGQRARRKWHLPEEVSYACGQPMGAYSSWAMLALTHHFIVQFAAWKVYGSKQNWFTMYALLGDDIVIADKDVATEYYSIMTSTLGVEINAAKSLISNDGTFEFAKRFILRGSDATPISLKGFLVGLRNLPAMESILAQIPERWGTRISDILRCLGYGPFGGLSYVDSPRALATRSRLQGLLVFLSRPGGLCKNRDFLTWVSQDSWSCIGGRVTDDSLNNIWRAFQRLAEEKLQKKLNSSWEKLNNSLEKWFPTTTNTTRLQAELFDEQVYMPIRKDMWSKILELEALLKEWKGQSEVDIDLLNKYIEELIGIEEEVENLPDTYEVDHLIKEKQEVISRVYRLWRQLRGLVRKD